MTAADIAGLSATLSGISPLGFVLVGLLAIYRGWVWTASAHAAVMADRDRWIAEITAQRNSWQSIAEGAISRMERLTTAVETLSRTQLPR